MDCTLGAVVPSSDEGSEAGDHSVSAMNASEIPPQYIAPPWSSVLQHAAPINVLRTERRDGLVPQGGPTPVWQYPPSCKPPATRVVRELGELSGNGSDGAHYYVMSKARQAWIQVDHVNATRSICDLLCCFQAPFYENLGYNPVSSSLHVQVSRFATAAAQPRSEMCARTRTWFSLVLASPCVSIIAHWTVQNQR